MGAPANWHIICGVSLWPRRAQISTCALQPRFAGHRNMRKSFRRSALTLLALFLIATIVIWIRSYWVHDSVILIWNRQNRINAFTNQVNARRVELEWGMGSIRVDYLYVREYPDQPVSNTTSLKVVHDPPGKPVIMLGDIEWMVQFKRLGFFAWKEFSGLNEILAPGLDGGNQRWVVVLPIGFLTALLAFLILLAWIRTRRKFTKDLCLSCGYDLKGNVSGVCPECGTAAHHQSASNQLKLPEAMRRPTRTRRLSIAAIASLLAFGVVAAAGVRSFWDEMDFRSRDGDQ